MGYERRGNARHYYAKVRDRGSVRSVHVGRDLAEHFGRLDAGRDALQRRRRERRSLIEQPMNELKRLLDLEADLYAALLYGAGHYRHHGEWRVHVRARLCKDDDLPSPDPGANVHPSAVLTEADYEAYGFTATPDGPTGPPATALLNALKEGPVSDAECDRLLRHLAEVVAGLDEREAMPGDVWALGHARLRPLFDAWMRQAVALKASLTERCANHPGFTSGIDAETAELGAADWSGPELGWDGTTNYTLGLVPSVAGAAAYLTALDLRTLVGLRELHPGTFTDKQWRKALDASRARLVRARMGFSASLSQHLPHVRALVAAGDAVERTGRIHTL